MAIIPWPTALGYTEFSMTPERVRGPHVHRSVFTGKPHVSYGGGRRRRGYVVTPVSRTGQIQVSITRLVQQLSDPTNQLSLGIPSAGFVDVVTCHVVRLHPPERDDRGTWRGWRLDLVEIGTGDSTLPEPEADCGLPLIVRGDIIGRVDVDRYNWCVSMVTHVSVELRDNAEGVAGDLTVGIYGEDNTPVVVDIGIVDPVRILSVPAGNYYVTVEGRNNNTNTEYELTIRELIIDQALPLDVRSQNNLSGSNDFDVYPFSVSIDADVRFVVTGLTAGARGDLDLTVFRLADNTRVHRALVSDNRPTSQARLTADTYMVGLFTRRNINDTAYRLQVTAS